MHDMHPCCMHVYKCVVCMQVHAGTCWCVQVHEGIFRCVCKVHAGVHACLCAGPCRCMHVKARG